MIFQNVDLEYIFTFQNVDGTTFLYSKMLIASSYRVNYDNSIKIFGIFIQ